MVKQAKSKPKKSSTVAGGRTRKLTKKQAKQKAKQTAAKQAPIPSSFKLLKQSYELIRLNWRLFGGIILVYTILNIVFSSGLLSDLSSSISSFKNTHHLTDAISGYGSLLGGSSGGAQASSVMESVLLVLESLVIIWALRQRVAGEKISIKQAYYNSMSPLVPFLLIGAVLVIQLLPLTLGSGFLALVLSSTVVGGSLLTFLGYLVFIVLGGWTLYLISGSLFSAYIVTLPGVHPRQALRSAKNLARFRRWQILRRTIFLPLFVLLILGIVTIPLIIVASFLVVPVFFLLLMLAIFFAHTYLYSLYRGLIE